MRHLSGLAQTERRTSGIGIAPVLMTTQTSHPVELGKRWYPGITAGAGWTLRLSKVRISPEIRYTRWTANVSQDRDFFSLRRPLQFPPNRIEILIGISYRAF